MEKVGAIIPAAGRSTRMAGIDKLFVPLCGRPLLAWCVEVLESSVLVSEVVISVAAETANLVELMARERGWRKTRLVEGGVRRQDSVMNALNTLNDVDWIIVHDGDRPFLTDALIERGLSSARETGAAVAAVPLKDTVKMVKDDMVVRTLNRDDLRAVQTPQVFRAGTLRQAHSDSDSIVTDDAALAEGLGCRVRLYDGSHDNLKVTTPDDLVLARAIADKWMERR